MTADERERKWHRAQRMDTALWIAIGVVGMLAQIAWVIGPAIHL
jgi:hypothetical protein